MRQDHGGLPRAAAETGRLSDEKYPACDPILGLAAYLSYERYIDICDSGSDFDRVRPCLRHQSAGSAAVSGRISDAYPPAPAHR